MNLLSRAKWLKKETDEAKANLKEVFQNEAILKTTRWNYFLAYSSINNDLNIGLPKGYIELAEKQGLAPWQDEFTPPGWIVYATELVQTWELKGLDVTRLKDFFMETAITAMVITDE